MRQLSRGVMNKKNNRGEINQIDETSGGQMKKRRVNRAIFRAGPSGSTGSSCRLLLYDSDDAARSMTL